MTNFPSISRRSASKPRVLRLEPLETRAMLSHPTVAAVNIGSTQWTQGFISFLESSGLGVGGYAIPVGSSNQLKSLPWKNINQIHITFSEDVNVKSSDLCVSGVNTACYAFSAFTYNSNTCTATWTLAAPIVKDKLMLDLDADGMSPVTSVSTGDVLDGAWTNGSSAYNSGNGTGGADFEFRLNVATGDVNQNGSVNSIDKIYVVLTLGCNAGDAEYSIFCDIDGSATIRNEDKYIVTQFLGQGLPAGNPVGMSDDAPTTGGIADLGIATGAENHVLALTDYFNDAETDVEDLAYSVVGNTNPSMFDSLTIDSSGNLDLDFTSTAYGSVTLTIRAADASGLFTETTVTVHVSDAPVISNFYCINEYSDTWTITGVVTDADDSVEGDVVTFGGVLAGYNLTATVRADGVFTITVELIGLQEGVATAQTKDPNGVFSEVAEDLITIV
jgi:hypothetical protein